MLLTWTSHFATSESPSTKWNSPVFISLTIREVGRYRAELEVAWTLFSPWLAGWVPPPAHLLLFSGNGMETGIRVPSLR